MSRICMQQSPPRSSNKRFRTLWGPFGGTDTFGMCHAVSMTASASCAHQTVTFHARHHEAILTGTKRLTVRWEEDIHVGPASFVFEPGANLALDGEVLRVELCESEDLSPEAVHETSETDMVEYVDTLRRRYYPNMPQHPQLQIVTFRLTGDRL